MYLSADVGDITTVIAPNTAVAGLLKMATNVIDFIIGNPILLVLFSGSLVGIACYVVQKVKKTAKA